MAGLGPFARDRQGIARPLPRRAAAPALAGWAAMRNSSRPHSAGTDTVRFVEFREDAGCRFQSGALELAGLKLLHDISTDPRKRRAAVVEPFDGAFKGISSTRLGEGPAREIHVPARSHAEDVRATLRRSRRALSRASGEAAPGSLAAEQPVDPLRNLSTALAFEGPPPAPRRVEPPLKTGAISLSTLGVFRSCR